MRQSLQMTIALCLCFGTGAPSAAEPPHRVAQAPQSKKQLTVEHGHNSAVQETPSATRRTAWRALMMLRGLRALSDIPPAVREELRHHAQRMARLQRIRGLAVEAHDQATLRRVDKLVGREQIRHHDKLARIWPPPAASSATAVEPKPDDAQDDDKPRDREGEDDDDSKEGEP